MSLKTKLGVQIIYVIDQRTWWNNWITSVGFPELTFTGTHLGLMFLFRTQVLIILSSTCLERNMENQRSLV